MDATLPFRWRRSPSHGKCSRRFCGSLRNYGRSHHQHQRETLDGHALKSNRREECVLMPAKMSRSAPRPPFRLREVSIAVRTLRLSCRKAGKAPIFTPVRESSGESRFSVSVLHESTWTATPICYLEDLFVDPDYRRHGLGRLLIKDLVDRAKSQGWSRLYWHTQKANSARNLYDEFGAADDFVRYRLVFDQYR